MIALYGSTRAEELAQLPWDDGQRDAFIRMQFAAQQQDYQRRFPLAEQLLILHEGHRLGRIYVARSDEEIRILDIAFTPEHRKKGFGTLIIRDLLNEAAQARKPVRIYVESLNPALGLFERLGFLRADDIGTHLLMEWQAAE